VEAWEEDHLATVGLVVVVAQVCRPQYVLYLTDNLCAQFSQHHSAKAAFAQRASDPTAVQAKQTPLPTPLAQC